jgi:transmembrane sensor
VIQGNRILTCHITAMKNNFDTLNNNWELLAKYLCNEASEPERHEVEAWAGDSDINLAELRYNRELMEKASLWFANRHFDETGAWEKITNKIQAAKNAAPEREKSLKFPAYRTFMRIAASVLLAVALGTAGYFLGFQQQKAAIFTEVITSNKQVVKDILLPDGTKVTLNSNSHITYPKTFVGDTREITITGEAFFEVEPDISKPFIISAGKAEIKVLGTSFNVCAYPDAESVDVVVESGKVQVSCANISESADCNLVLAPGEKGTLSNKDLNLVKTHNKDPNLSAWRTKQFIFLETPLSEVITSLEKVYFVDIRMSDPSMGNLLLTANFKDQPVDFILDVIKLTFNLELTSLNGEYFLANNLNK